METPLWDGASLRPTLVYPWQHALGAIPLLRICASKVWLQKQLSWHGATAACFWQGQTTVTTCLADSRSLQQW